MCAPWRARAMRRAACDPLPGTRSRAGAGSSGTLQRALGPLRIRPQAEEQRPTTEPRTPGPSGATFAHASHSWSLPRLALHALARATPRVASWILGVELREPLGDGHRYRPSIAQRTLCAGLQAPQLTCTTSPRFRLAPRVGLGESLCELTAINRAVPESPHAFTSMHAVSPTPVAVWLSAIWLLVFVMVLVGVHA